MYSNRKMIVVSPVGRRETMGHLFRHILLNRHVIDEHHLWVNTNVQEDLEYIYQHAKEHPDFVKLKYGCSELDPEQMGKAGNVSRFYEYCTEPNTFYIKIDDDFIFIESGTFEKLAQYKIDNPETFLTFPIVVNNQWCTYFLQKNKKIDLPECPVLSSWYEEYEKVKKEISQSQIVKSEDPTIVGFRDFGNLENVALSPMFWGDSLIAYKILASFADLIRSNEIQIMDVQNIVLKSHENVSIGFILWSGEDFAKFNGKVKMGDEPWLSCFYPLQNNLFNAIVGNTRAVHFAYYTQRDFLRNTNLLEMYSSL